MRPILLLPLLLAACAEPAAVAQNACPPIKPYTTAEQQQAADELLKLPPGSMLGQMIVDYGAERARLRACRAAAPGARNRPAAHASIFRETRGVFVATGIH